MLFASKFNPLSLSPRQVQPLRATMSSKTPSPTRSKVNVEEQETPGQEKLETPKQQIRHSTSDADADADATTVSEEMPEPLKRADSASPKKMMRLLFPSTSEDETSPCTHISASESASESQDSQLCESQSAVEADESQSGDAEDGEASEEDNREVVVATPGDNSGAESVVAQPGSPSRNPSSCSDSSSEHSQVREMDNAEDNFVMEHSEHMENVIQSCGFGDRQLLCHSGKNSTGLRLRHHTLDPRPALCLFTAIDDGSRLFQPGLVWSVDSTTDSRPLWEVVAMGTMGWSDAGPSGNKRSHKIVPKGPVYGFVRSADLVGQQLVWNQLKRLHIRDIFTYGDPVSTVNKVVLQKAQTMFREFVDKNDKNILAWERVVLVKPSAKVLQGVPSDSGKTKSKSRPSRGPPLRRSKRFLALEQKQLNASRERQKRQDEMDRRAQQAALRKAAKLEAQRQKRAIKSEVKSAVASALTSFRRSFTKKINDVHNLVKTVRDAGDKAVTESLEDLGGRLEHLSEEVERLVDNARNNTKSTKLVDKRAKKLKTSIETFKTVTEQKFKELNEDMNMMKKRSKAKAKSAKKRKRDSQSDGGVENKRPSTNAGAHHSVGSLPPPVLPPHVVVTRPPTPMIPRPNTTAVKNNWWGRGYQVSPSAGEIAPGSHSNYMSPMYASRNFSR